MSRKQKKHQRHKRRLYPATIKIQEETPPTVSPQNIEAWDDDAWDEYTDIGDDLDAWDDRETAGGIERMRRQDRVPTRKSLKENERRQLDRERHRVYRRIARDLRRQRFGKP